MYRVGDYASVKTHHKLNIGIIRGIENKKYIVEVEKELIKVSESNLSKELKLTGICPICRYSITRPGIQKGNKIFWKCDNANCNSYIIWYVK